MRFMNTWGSWTHEVHEHTRFMNTLGSVSLYICTKEWIKTPHVNRHYTRTTAHVNRHYTRTTAQTWVYCTITVDDFSSDSLKKKGKTIKKTRGKENKTREKENKTWAEALVQRLSDGFTTHVPFMSATLTAASVVGVAFASCSASDAALICCSNNMCEITFSCVWHDTFICVGHE